MVKLDLNFLAWILVGAVAAGIVLVAARSVQASLMPGTIPVIAGIESEADERRPPDAPMPVRRVGVRETLPLGSDSVGPLAPATGAASRGLRPLLP